jgi:hypothetical protein
VGTIAMNQVCPKAGTLSPITIKSGQSVTVKAGCNIPTMDLSADDSEDVEIVNSWLDWMMSLSQLFNHDDNAQRTAMIMVIRKHINGDFETSQLFKRLDNVQKPFSADHWRFSSPAAMIRVALLIAVVSFAVWKKCCAQARQTANAQLLPTPPVTQQPLPQPQPQVQIQPQPQPQVKIQQQLPPAYSQQNPTFNFKQPTAPVLIYT